MPIRSRPLLEAHGVQEYFEAEGAIEVLARFREHLFEVVMLGNIGGEWLISHRAEGAQLTRS